MVSGCCPACHGPGELLWPSRTMITIANTKAAKIGRYGRRRGRARVETPSDHDATPKRPQHGQSRMRLQASPRRPLEREARPRGMTMPMKRFGVKFMM